MPRRKVIFANNEVYHLINRGVAQAPIFLEKRDFQRMIELINFYRYQHPPLRFSHYYRLPKDEKAKFLQNLKKNHSLIVEILAFSLLKNHFHFLSKQLKKNGVTTFMKQIQASYALYFNTKYKRVGPLFQATFRAIRIETDAQLLHVSRYIHLNPSSSYLVKAKELENYPWSSFPVYLDKRTYEFVETSFILSYLKNKASYKKFVFDRLDYQRELEKIKHLILE